LFSEYFVYLHENKTLFTVWNTNSTSPHCKFTITDETITAFTVDVNGVLIAGTINGKVIVHDVAVGNVVKNISFGNKEICAITRYDSSLVIVLDKEKVSALLFGDLLNNTNTSKEVFVLYFKEGENYDHMCINCGKVYLYNNSCIVEMDVDDKEGMFIVRKMFYMNNEHVYDMKVKWNEMYFTNKYSIKNNILFEDLNNRLVGPVGPVAPLPFPPQQPTSGLFLLSLLIISNALSNPLSLLFILSPLQYNV
jgi:hypothetical protein